RLMWRIPQSSFPDVSCVTRVAVRHVRGVLYASPILMRAGSAPIFGEWPYAHGSASETGRRASSFQGVDVLNGVEQKVGADELFFSTTDRQGRIRSGNSVFARISQFSIEELVGSPHNIVRHPEMPAGVFRLIWDRLYADRPVGTYVKNLAR